MGKAGPSGSGIAFGCALGCGVVLLSLVAIAVVGYFWVQKQFDVLAVEAVASMDESMAQHREDDDLPEDHVALLEQVIGTAHHDDASPYVKFACVAIYTFVEVIEEDDEEKEEMLEAAQNVADFMAANPDMGLTECMKYFGEHPEAQDMFESFSRAMEKRFEEEMESLEDGEGAADEGSTDDGPVEVDTPEESETPAETEEAESAPVV